MAVTGTRPTRITTFQRRRDSCACVVILVVHVRNVVSGGGHRQSGKTEVSYETLGSYFNGFVNINVALKVVCMYVVL